jgi:polyketide biosynthesis enoyl-CoA hydratase PksH
VTATEPTAAASDLVAIRRDHGVVWVTLSRPETGNTLRPDMLDEVHRAIDLAESDVSCRALVLDSSGDRFCTGLDLAHAQQSRAWHDGGADTAYWRLLNRLHDTPVVTVAAVDGAAIGGGVGLACSCDLVLAGDAARFRLTELLLGLLPGMVMPFLARRVGEQYAFRMALLAPDVEAEEAARRGLADTHVPRAADGVRRVLASLRPTDRGTLSDLKTMRRLLFPVSAEYGLYAGRLLGHRLDDPEVADRIARLRREGMLP